MGSEVYFVPAETDGKSLLSKLKDLVVALPLSELLTANERIAVKVHMGAKGCTRYLRPIFGREIINIIKELGMNPFLTDTTTLYPGDRWSSRGYSEIAIAHGFVEEVLGCQVVIADDSKHPSKILSTKGGRLSEVEVAGAIAEAEGLVVISHVKGHDLAGFGGAIKNVGMGCLTKSGKSQVDVATKPTVDLHKCTGCGLCTKVCLWDAIDT